MKIIDLIGQRFAKLVVFSRIEHTSPVKWLCVCDCGGRIEVIGGNLKSGNTRSCGCMFPFLKYSDETMSSKKYLYYKYKKRFAGDRGYNFLLTFEEFVNLVQKNCYYCGEKPLQYYRNRDAKKGLFYNGLDRINNKRGYETDNVVPCCGECNRAKWDRDREEFVSWLKDCYEYLSYKN